MGLRPRIARPCTIQGYAYVRYTCTTARPPAAQFLYDLGLVNDTDSVSTLLHHDPASKDTCDKFATPTPATLPLRCLSPRHSVGAKAAKFTTPTPHSILDEFEIDKDVMANVYLSPDPYHYSFPETLDLRRFDSTKHPTAGMNFITTDYRVFLGSMAKSTPAAKIPRWRSRLRQAWLIKINDTTISSIADVRTCLADLDRSNATKCTLLFSHPEVKHGLTNGGIPQINLDQLNNRLLLRPSNTDILSDMPQLPNPALAKNAGWYVQDEDDPEGVINFQPKVMKLTCSKLIKQPDWDE